MPALSSMLIMITPTTPRQAPSVGGLGWIAGILDNVSLVEFGLSVPEVQIDRLNEHYADVVALSRLILRHGAFEAGREDVRASGFLMDMNTVFQEFVTVALREALGVSDRVFREGNIRTLDEEGRVNLRPTSPGGTAGSACSLATQNTRSSPKSVFPTPIFTRCSPMPPRSICRWAAGLRAGGEGAWDVPHALLGEEAGGSCAGPVRHTRFSTQTCPLPGAQGEGHFGMKH